MTKVIGVDIGYGRTKVYDGERRGNFPSAVSSQVAEEATFESHLRPFLAHGRAYITGEDAEIHARTVEDTRNESFLGSGGWFALLAHALRGAGYDPDCEGAVIAIGLPPGMCGPDRYREVLRTVKETSVLDKSSGRAYRFTRTRVIIVPQGVGIYYYYHMTSPEAAARRWPSPTSATRPWTWSSSPREDTWSTRGRRGRRASEGNTTTSCSSPRRCRGGAPSPGPRS